MIGFAFLTLVAVGVSRAGAAIPSIPTSETALVGYFGNGPTDLALRVDRAMFIATFGSAETNAWPAEIQARRFFEHGGASLIVVRVADGHAILGRESDLTGLNATRAFDFRLLLIPEITRLPAAQLPSALAELKSFADEKLIFVILDPPEGWTTAQQAADWVGDHVPTDASGMAIYWPYLDSTLDGLPVRAGASGAMAALYAQNDAAHEIWDSPAGRDLPLIASATSPGIGVTESEILNSAGICPIREFAGIGIIPFGARTLDPDDGEERYIALARTLRWIDASIASGMAFVAAADNRAGTWNQMLSDALNFCSDLFTRGAFAGVSKSECYFLAIGEGITMSAQDVTDGIAILDIGLALVRPSEFTLRRHRFDTHDANLPTPEPRIFIRKHEGQAYLSFPTFPGYSFALQSGASPRHQSLGFPSPGDGHWRRAIAPITAVDQFYRVEIESAR